MVRSIDRKLLRDLSQLKGQVATIALVVAAGITAYVSTFSVYRSLSDSAQAYYERERFADVFAQLERAPDALLERLNLLPGVAQVEGRVVKNVLLDMPDLPEPVTGQLVSIPSRGPPLLNQLYLREGRMVEPGRTDEVIVNEAFATAHHLEPGDRIVAVVNGRRVALRMVGVALSPEYVYAVPPGGIWGDDLRFGILWMDRDALAAAFHMEGAFNDALVRLSPGASPEGVVDALDRQLKPYGGLGALPRKKQISSRYVASEIQQLYAQATIVPLIFLGVAAFLVNVVLSRLIGTQREQIAALKALGYSDLTVGLHYLKLVAVVVTIGAVLGTGVGMLAGHGLLNLYRESFRFPVLTFELDLGMLVGSILISFASAVVGALAAVRQVARLPPAEAMLPAAPPTYRLTLLERSGFHRLFTQAGRMVLRDLERRPWRLLLSSMGIGLAVAILIVGSFSIDSVRYLMGVQYGLIQREALSVSFSKSVPDRARRELEQIPGVLHAEPLRMVPVRLVAGPRSYETVIQGIPSDGEHRQVLDAKRRPVPLEAGGLMLGRELARRLGVGLGDRVRIEVQDGSRPIREARVAFLVDDLIGISAYMEIKSLDRLIGDDPSITGATLAVDPARMDDIYARIKKLPLVVGVGRTELVKRLFEQQVANVMVVFTVMLAGFAAAIAVGIVYNNARVALSVRARDLASLRVLGFTRREISVILLSEIVTSLLLALPLGLVLGRGLTLVVAGTAVDTELFRLPAIIDPRTYAFAVLVVLVAGVVSALLVRRRLDHLDLIGVLKTRE
ncbi:ABC transporter permease [Hyalangium versicolor]|uniref:ABC transporter permease n=1 Tax=Hyalangium versicolor TaxID=2861190 RepID=UPI001CCD5C9D|nr:ABC transporter permease [Hyalangium versicolor]